MKNKIDCARFFESLNGLLDEKNRRYVVAAAALSSEYGGATAVAKAARVTRSVVYEGIKELSSLPESHIRRAAPRQRRKGGGPKPLAVKDKTLLADLDSLIKPHVHGDPESLLRWTSRSLRNISAALRQMGHSISHASVGKLLESQGYTLQSNKKSHEGGKCEDRDAQFEHISRCATIFQNAEMPVISVDAKKKELIGNFKNNGREYHPKGDAPEVEVYDFVNENGKATPYGIYDIAANEGFVNVGISHDTASFAVDSIRRWWEEMGEKRYGEVGSLLINADGGGSNGSRNRLWKGKLQEMANDYDMNIYVSHFPPGTSKWNKIEHRMFSFISKNWRGKPLETTAVIVNLIAATATASGLRIKSKLDIREYKTGEKVADQEMGRLNIVYHDFHPEWNYVIRPQKKP